MEGAEGAYARQDTVQPVEDMLLDRHLGVEGVRLRFDVIEPWRRRGGAKAAKATSLLCSALLCSTPGRLALRKFEALALVG